MVVLGLLGEANSGKDFVADWFVNNRNFVSVGFADVMKRHVRFLFDLSVDHLWGKSELRQLDVLKGEPAEAWAKYTERFADFQTQLTKEMDFKSVIRDGLLKKALYSWWVHLQITYPKNLTLREILQTLGTEMGRSFDRNLWSSYLNDKVIPRLKDGWWYTRHSGLAEEPYTKWEGVIVPDHRFKNEITTSQQSGGYVIRLVRISQEAKKTVVGIPNHASENEQKEISDFDVNLVLELLDGPENVYPILENVYKEKKWTIGRGTKISQRPSP